MPGLIGISEFVDEAVDDYNSPTTSTFVSKMAQCRQTISGLEDVSTAVQYVMIFPTTYPPSHHHRFFGHSVKCDIYTFHVIIHATLLLSTIVKKISIPTKPNTTQINMFKSMQISYHCFMTFYTVYSAIIIITAPAPITKI